MTGVVEKLVEALRSRSWCTACRSWSRPRSGSRCSPTTAWTSTRCCAPPTWPCTRPRRRQTGYGFFDGSTHQLDLARLTLVGELRRALEKRELVLHYQPKAVLDDGEVRSVEALLRWKHPERGLIGPGRVHPPRPADRPDQAADALRDRRGAPAVPRLGAQGAGARGRRQRLDAQPARRRVPSPGAGPARRWDLDADAAPARDHRGRRARPIRCARRRSSRSSPRWASGSRSTTSAPATPRSPTSSACRSHQIKIDRSFVMGMAERRGRRDDRALDDRPRSQPRAGGRGGGRGERADLGPPARPRLHGRAGLLPQPARCRRTSCGLAAATRRAAARAAAAASCRSPRRPCRPPARGPARP